METTTSLEEQRAHDLAEEYRKKGYHVIEKPSPEQLPDFLSSYRPDLLARKGQTGVVVEVKSRASPGQRSEGQGSGTTSPDKSTLEP